MDDDRDDDPGAAGFTDYDDFNDPSEYNDGQYDDYYDEISEDEYYTPFPKMDSVIREAAVGFKVLDYHDEEVFCLGHIEEIPVQHNIHPDLLSSRSLKLMKKLKECTTVTDIPLQLIDMLEHRRSSNYVLNGINQKKEWRSLFRSPSSTSFKRCSLCDKKKSAPINMPRLTTVPREEKCNRNIKSFSAINCRQVNSLSSNTPVDYFPMTREARQMYIRNLRQTNWCNKMYRSSSNSIPSSPKENCTIQQSSKTSISIQCDDSSMSDFKRTNSKSVQYNPVGGIPSAGDVILFSNPRRWNNKHQQKTCGELNYNDKNSSRASTDLGSDNQKRTSSNTSLVSSLEEDTLEDICVELKFEQPKRPSDSCISQHENSKQDGSIISSKSVLYVTAKPTRQHSSTFNNYLVHRMSIPPSEASDSPNDDQKSGRGQPPENPPNVVILYKSPTNTANTTSSNASPATLPIQDIFKTKNTSYRFDSDTSSSSSGVAKQSMRKRPPPRNVDRLSQDVNQLNRCPNRTNGLNAMQQRCKTVPPTFVFPRTNTQAQHHERYKKVEDVVCEADDEFDLTNQDLVEKFLRRNRNN